MKIQLVTAATVLAFSSTAFGLGMGGHHGGRPGTTIDNKTKNSIAVGKMQTGGASSHSLSGPYGGSGSAASNSYLSVDAGRAIAGSIVLETDACACDYKSVKNRSKNNIAIGNATAGSVHLK